MLRARCFWATVSFALMAAGLASAQDYPTKPIRIITTTVGGGSDFTSRLLAPAMSASLGQPLIVDNRTAMISAESVSKAPPDGYTLLITGSSFWIGPLLQKVQYHPVRDFAPLSQITREVTVLVAH